MKRVFSNGRVLTVREIGPVLMALRPRDARTALRCVDEDMEDDAAREYVQDLLDSGYYVQDRTMRGKK